MLGAHFFWTGRGPRRWPRRVQGATRLRIDHRHSHQLYGRIAKDGVTMKRVGGWLENWGNSGGNNRVRERERTWQRARACLLLSFIDSPIFAFIFFPPSIPKFGIKLHNSFNQYHEISYYLRNFDNLLFFHIFSLSSSQVNLRNSINSLHVMRPKIRYYRCLL